MIHILTHVCNSSAVARHVDHWHSVINQPMRISDLWVWWETLCQKLRLKIIEEENWYQALGSKYINSYACILRHMHMCKSSRACSRIPEESVWNDTHTHTISFVAWNFTNLLTDVVYWHKVKCFSSCELTDLFIASFMILN